MHELKWMGFVKFIVFGLLGLAVVGCGDHHVPKPRTTKIFKTKGTGDKEGEAYSIDVNSQDFGSTVSGQPRNFQPGNGLTKKIRGLKINVDLENPDQFFIALRYDGHSTANFKLESLNNRNEILDGEGRFSLLVTCHDNLCSRAGLRLKEISSGLLADIEYVRTYEYLAPGDERKHKVTGAEASLIRDAIEYRFPIERHSVRINGSIEADILVVTPPAVDSDDETGETMPAPVLELESRSTIYVPVEQRQNPSAPTTDGNDQPDAGHQNETQQNLNQQNLNQQSENHGQQDSRESETQQPVVPEANPAAPIIQQKPSPGPARTAPVKPSSESMETIVVTGLRLTPNPLDVYNVELPSSLFKSQQTLRDPLALDTNFQIKPISMQQEFEPSYRIAVIAKAFIDQKVKIYKNACNIFVRAVMTLAGYTEGGHYQSNDLGILFRSESQGLNRWQQHQYKFSTTSQKTNQMMDSFMARIPEYHGVILQVDRRSEGRHGHSGIITRINGKTIMFDSSIPTRTWPGYPPRMTTVTSEDLLKTSRKKVNLYVMPNLVPAGAVDI